MNTRDIRQSILMAADKIERFPHQFEFIQTDIPDSCTGCGCALGWIGYFAGVRGINANAVELLTGARDTSVFYTRMSEIRHGWTYEAKACASNMRSYADKYFPNDTADCNDPVEAKLEETFGGERSAA